MTFLGVGIGMKRGGGGLGPEVLANGDFSGGATGWTVANNDATHIATFSGGTLRFQADTLSPAMTVSQAGVLVVGRTYRVTVVVSANAGTGGLKTDNLSPLNQVMAGPAPGTYTMVGTAVSANFSFTRNAANVDITLDSISVREVIP